MSPAALNEELEVLGVSVESAVLSETISLTLNALAKDADRALQLFEDMIRRPAFDPAPLETYRGQVVEDLRRLADSSSRLAAREFARLILKLVRREDVAVRWGGEEFLIMREEEVLGIVKK